MVRTFLIMGAFLLFCTTLNAQHQEQTEKQESWNDKRQTGCAESNSLLNAFKNGSFNGHFRQFSMATNNTGNLSDYYAIAIGGGVKFETAKFHNFQFGVSGFYIFNVGSSNLNDTDPLSHQKNRYEIALFDIENPSNKNNIDRLEELYIKYNFKKSHFTLGKQLLNTPFINLQDGRMRPTETEGLWSEIKEIENTTIEGGYLYKISPRSTVEYYSIGESIGIYPSGVNTDGTKAMYSNNLESKGIVCIGITNKSINNVTLQVWNQHVENIFNTAMLQTDYKINLKNKTIVDIGLQSVYQSALHNGGNEDVTKTYFDRGAKALTFGTKLGVTKSNLDVSLNYNRIAKTGRYLMPREWGRDPFYTFLPRERNDGLGDVNAYVLKLHYSKLAWNLKSSIGIGYYNLPSVENYKLNKYGLPSYTQLNADVKYECKGKLEGFDIQFLFVHKWNSSNETLFAKNILNRVDMSNLSFIINFHF